MQPPREPWPGVPEGRRRIMQGNRRRDTEPELALRRVLHASGLRFRVNHPIRLDGPRPVRPDVVFTRWRVAVFVDGCFWHGCLDHSGRPKVNAGYWDSKIEGNRVRDRNTDAALWRAGWLVVRTWQHEPPDLVARRVHRALAAAGRAPAD